MPGSVHLDAQHLNENRPGEAYVRKGSTWKLIGYIETENKESGIMTPVDE